MTAKESKDLRDESHSFYERDRNTHRERERHRKYPNVTSTV